MPFCHAGKSPDDDTKQALTGDVGRAWAAAASGEIGFLRRARVDWGDVLRKAVARRFVDRQTASSVQCRRYVVNVQSAAVVRRRRRCGREVDRPFQDTGGTRGMTS